MIHKEKIRNIIELFIAWNGETEAIDVANINSAVDFIAETLQKDTLDTIEKIRAEIERRKLLADEQKDNGYFFARSDAYAELLNFIDSLKEESLSNDLEEEIRMVKGDYEQVNVAWNNDFDFIARHFAKWQKQHLMESAIDAEIQSCGLFTPLISVKEYKEKIPNIKFGDKVKLLIFKEETDS